MRIRSMVVFGVFRALAAGLAAAPPPAPEPPPTSPFGEEIDVRVVNLEVVVTDRKGERVSGLSAADFTLSVDGKPVPVEYFSEIREGRLQATADAPAGAPGPRECSRESRERPLRAPPDPPAGAPRAGGVQPLAAAAAGTNYLVYIDDYFTVAQQRDQGLGGGRARARQH